MGKAKLEWLAAKEECSRAEAAYYAARDAAVEMVAVPRPLQITLTREEADMCVDALNEAIDQWQRYTADGNSRAEDAQTLRARILKALLGQECGAR